MLPAREDEPKSKSRKVGVCSLHARMSQRAQKESAIFACTLPAREDEPASTSGYSVHGGFLWVEISCLPTQHLVRCLSFL